MGDTSVLRIAGGLIGGHHGEDRGRDNREQVSPEDHGCALVLDPWTVDVRAAGANADMARNRTVLLCQARLV